MLLLTILSTIICMASMVLILTSKKKVDSLVTENIDVSKRNLDFKKSFSIMADDIEDLKNTSRDLIRTNNYLKKICNEVSEQNNKLTKQVIDLQNNISSLQEENKEIKRILAYHNMISPGLTLTKSFVGKLAKEG